MNNCHNNILPRLFPAILFTLFFYTFIWQYAASGPTYPTAIGDATNCRTNWWVDLLMVHNLVRRDTFVSDIIGYNMVILIIINKCSYIDIYGAGLFSYRMLNTFSYIGNMTWLVDLYRQYDLVS